MFSFYNKVLRAKYKLNNMLFYACSKSIKNRFSKIFSTLKNNTIYNIFDTYKLFCINLNFIFTTQKLNIRCVS